MWKRILGTLLAVVISSVGAFASPTRAAIEKAAATEHADRSESDSSTFPVQRAPDEPDSTDPKPIILLSTPQWTVEKVSRNSELPTYDRRMICPINLPVVRQSQGTVFNLARDFNANVIDLLPLPVRIYLIGANAPPIS